MSVSEIIDALEESQIDYSGYVSLTVSENDASQAKGLISQRGGDIIEENPHEAGVTITFSL